jgi:hypothetical protein
MIEWLHMERTNHFVKITREEDHRIHGDLHDPKGVFVCKTSIRTPTEHKRITDAQYKLLTI